jgi:transcriptional regulator with XRE-family HTH domain/mannose-6-phosphate isomerase-like protein (cupin superfamily)
VAAADNGHGEGDRTAGPDGVRIGAQLRAARHAARKSMAEVADEAGLTKGFVSKLERDLANVSVASLIRLCDALGVPVGSMFQASKGEIIRQGEYPPIDFGGTGMREYLLTPSGEKRVQVIFSDIRPGGGSGEEAYALPADVEFAFILAGRLHITVDHEEVTLEQGDAYTFRADAPHTFRSAQASGRTQVLWLVSPALPDTGWQRPANAGELHESH